jgi:hypothetical protein
MSQKKDDDDDDGDNGEGKAVINYASP